MPLAMQWNPLLMLLLLPPLANLAAARKDLQLLPVQAKKVLQPMLLQLTVLPQHVVPVANTLIQKNLTKFSLRSFQTGKA